MERNTHHKVFVCETIDTFSFYFIFKFSIRAVITSVRGNFFLKLKKDGELA